MIDRRAKEIRLARTSRRDEDPRRESGYKFEAARREVFRKSVEGEGEVSEVSLLNVEVAK